MIARECTFLVSAVTPFSESGLALSVELEVMRRRKIQEQFLNFSKESCLPQLFVVFICPTIQFLIFSKVSDVGDNSKQLSYMYIAAIQ